MFSDIVHGRMAFEKQTAHLQDQLFPVTVVQPGHAQYVFAGRHASFMTDLGCCLWAWGCNEGGILGIGSGVAKQLTPTRVETDGKKVQHVAGGWKHFLAVTVDGELLSWGSNEYGQLGDGTKTLRRVPTVRRLPGDVKADVVAAGSYHTLVLAETGEVFAAGMGYTQPGVAFQQVIRTGITMVVAGTSHNLALTKTGTVLAWGANDHGQVGNGLLDFQTSPTAVSRQQLVIAAGGCQSFCADDVYNMQAWGHGVVPADERSYECPARYSVSEPQDLFIQDGAFAIAVGDDHTLVVGALGQVSTFGANMCGQLGNNSRADLGRPTQILKHSTVEILSVEARIEANTIKGPVEEYVDTKAEASRQTSSVKLALGPPAHQVAQGESGGVPIMMRQAAGVPLTKNLVSHGPKTAT